ncbi:competence/damage-inducible protein A [Prochlorococcus marinus]|uniref:competence/damage-inducible protein A n=1 Tax=Prochlorococcus marinus TaxID=1219 RepID=UPI0022B4A7F7|nr:competence/damage-inducible protein A [Prochlorococcus marinus]
MRGFKEININNKNKFGAEVLCIGSEILLGNIVNTNSQWIAEQLAILGIPHFRQTVIGDNSARLKEAILEASNRSAILITTGGLGPTPDDITTQVIAETFNTPLEQRNDILLDLKNKSSDKKSKLSESQKKQSLVPKGSKIINNYSGTAPGFIWSPKNNFTILTFPGVPSELKEMWINEVEKWLINNNFSKKIISSKVLHFAGISESSLADKIKHLLKGENPTIATYASTGEVKVRITANGDNLEETNKLIKPIEKEITQFTGLKFFGVNNVTLEEIVFKLLLKRKETIAVAESCTGGGIGSKLTKIPGSSKIFHGGVIAYNNLIKQRVLGVPEEIIKSYGAVSKPVVELMARGVQKQFKVNWAIAVSGIAGPTGGSKLKPVGLVNFCIKGPKSLISWEERFGSNKTREDIQKLSVLNALDRLRLSIIMETKS